MARNSGQVNVGSIQTSGKDLSRLLLNSSNRFAAEAENKAKTEAKNKQLLEAKTENNRRYELNQTRLSNNEAESARRFGIQQTRMANNEAQNKLRYEADQNEKNAKKLALKEGNDFFAEFNEGRNPNLKENDYDNSFQKVFSTQRGKWDANEGQYREYLLNGKPEDLNSAIAGILPEKGVDKQKRLELQNRRRASIEIVREAAQNAGSTNERKAIEDKAILDIFGGRRDALNKDIAEGSFLTIKQKANAVSKNIPASYSAYFDNSVMQRNLISSMSGNTKEDLQKQEKDRVAGVNAERKSIYNADKLRYKAQIAQRKGNKDWKGLGKLLEQDLGYNDNKDRDSIIDYMVEQGVPHDRIQYAVKKLVKNSIFGTKSIPDADSPEVLDAVVAVVSEMEEEGIDIAGKIDPVKGYATEVEGNLNKIQERMMQASGTRSDSIIQLLPSWEKYKEKTADRLPEIGLDGKVVPKQAVDTVELTGPVAENIAATNNIVKDRNLMLKSNNSVDQAIMDGVGSVLTPIGETIAKGSQQVTRLKDFLGSRADQLRKSGGDIGVMRQQIANANAAEQARIAEK
jgi:hypothetical protein